MKCSELMKEDVETCPITAAIRDVATRMRERNIGFMPVCDLDGTVLGTITDRDLAMRVLGDARVPEATSALEVMTKNAICCSPRDELTVAEELMSRHKVSRIICTDDLSRAVGVISLSDIAGAERRGVASAVLRSVSQREARP